MSNGNTYSNDTSSSSSCLASVLQKDEQDVETFVLTFPEEYCGSVATGCFRVNNGNSNSRRNWRTTNATPQIIFCKDQDRNESWVQESMVKLGKRFGNVVAVCQRVKRPPIHDLDPHSAGAKMWHLKEEQWQKRKRRQDKNDDDNHDDNDSDSDSSSSSSSSSEASAPSSKEFWLLEEAVVYYDPTTPIKSNNDNNDNDNSHKPSVDKSLQYKLRRAADRSVSKSLDLVTLFMLTEFSQQKVQGSNPEWPDYVRTHRLPSSEQSCIMLTQEETAYLWENKLVVASSVSLQMAMVLTIVAGLPDNHCGNMAVQEVIDKDNNANNNWQLRIVHFDTGVLSTSVSLETLKLAYNQPSQDQVNYDCDFDFAGGRNARAYYYPILFSSIFAKASQAPLHEKVRQCLLQHNTLDLDKIFTTTATSPKGMVDKQVLKGRWKKMQDYVRNHPDDCSCQALAFHTIKAWKRDYTMNETHEVFVEWLKEVQQWANNNMKN